MIFEIPDLNKKQYWLVGSQCLNLLLSGLASPAMMQLSSIIIGQHPKLSTVNGFAFFLMGIVMSMVWKKAEKKLAKHYFKIEIVESIILLASTGFFIWLFKGLAELKNTKESQELTEALLKLPYLIYFWYNLIYGVTVTKFISKINSVFCNYLFEDKRERTDAQTAEEFYTNFFAAAGFGIALFKMPNIVVALILFAIADLFRTFSKVYTYCIQYKIDKAVANGENKSEE